MNQSHNNSTGLETVTLPAREVRVGDTVECLTADGWEFGKVVEILSSTRLSVHMDYIDSVREFETHFVK